MRIEATKSGRPALWEEGGGMTSSGSATLIADTDGGPASAQFVPRGGSLACGKHALIPVKAGMFVIFAGHGHGAASIRIERIEAINPGERAGTFDATTRVVGEYQQGGWVRPLPADMPLLALAAARAKSKSYSYHDRSVWWAVLPDQAREEKVRYAQEDNNRRIADRAAKAAREIEERAAENAALEAEREAARLQYESEAPARARAELARWLGEYSTPGDVEHVLGAASAADIGRLAAAQREIGYHDEVGEWCRQVDRALGGTGDCRWTAHPAGDVAGTLSRHLAKRAVAWRKANPSAW